MSVPLSAIVLASRGGERLARALASVDWAAERLVLDPRHRLVGHALPAGARPVVDPVREASAPWLLLLDEHECVPASLAAEIAAAIAAGDRAAYRIAEEVRSFGAIFRPLGAAIRLARREGSRFHLSNVLGVAFARADGAVGRLDGRLLTTGAETLAAAVDELDADAAALAALLHAGGAQPRLRHLALAPLLPAVRALVARGPVRDLWPRWALAVLHGYRTAATYGKLWELRELEASTPR